MYGVIEVDRYHTKLCFYPELGWVMHGVSLAGGFRIIISCSCRLWALGLGLYDLRGMDGFTGLA